MACSLRPGYFHHWRSKARISRSRCVSSPSASAGIARACGSEGCAGTSAASIWLLATGSVAAPESHACDSVGLITSRYPPPPPSMCARVARSFSGYGRRMAIRPIVIAGDPVLHHPTRPVETFDDELKTLVEDMFETMAAAPGVGLAAAM